MIISHKAGWGCLGKFLYPGFILILQHISQGVRPDLPGGIFDTAAVFDDKRALRHLADGKLVSLGNILL